LVKKSVNNYAKIILNLLALAIVAFLVVSISFSGCKSKPEGVIEEPGKEVEEETGISEEQKEEISEEITSMQITGNINILSGLEVSGDVNDSRPIAVMIENHPDARPQSGLHLADVVFEVVDEGGITRYVALYSSYDAEILGPVRSARQYYAEIARGFDPIYAFWGTYPEGYKIIEDMDLDVLSVLGDQSGNSSITAQASHWRDNSRVAPHNGYMSTLQLKEDAKRVGYSLEGGNSPFKFKLDAPQSERGSISDITVDFSTPQFSINFKYDKAGNNYLKYISGSPHTDRETGKQITVNNVIVMITDIAGPIDSAGHMAVRTTGSGKAYFFMDGNVVEGSWERTSVFDPFTYKDSDGNQVLFNRGQTWIAMVQGIDRVIY